ncbi:hypothetical protein ACO2FQ_13445 [Lacticaseibacillus paracasei]|nr:hypothetical protein [Lacticaseibacillus paracasei]
MVIKIELIFAPSGTLLNKDFLSHAVTFHITLERVINSVNGTILQDNV